MLDATSRSAGPRWVSLHVFYAANNPDPMLVDCVAPLVADLRGRGLLDRWFFIRYWLEGPHVRLRLRPATPADEAEVRRRTEERVGAFLRARPAEDAADAVDAAAAKRMFLAEYSEREWADRYGADGVMPVRPNNTYAYVEYAPEYHRYGGAAGVELAEWHFERSSDVVVRLLAATDAARRGVRLGLAAQLMTVMCTAFLREPAAVAAYLAGYGAHWARFAEAGGDAAGRRREPDGRGDRAGAAAADRLGTIHRLVAAGRTGAASSPLGSWAAHCAELRGRAADLARQGRLVFGAVDSSGGHRAGDDPDRALRLLLGSYLHMTNNRLGATLDAESYLAHTVRRAVADGGQPDSGP